MIFLSRRICFLHTYVFLCQIASVFPLRRFVLKLIFHPETFFHIFFAIAIDQQFAVWSAKFLQLIMSRPNWTGMQEGKRNETENVINHSLLAVDSSSKSTKGCCKSCTHSGHPCECVQRKQTSSTEDVQVTRCGAVGDAPSPRGSTSPPFLGESTCPPFLGESTSQPPSVAAPSNGECVDCDEDTSGSDGEGALERQQAIVDELLLVDADAFAPATHSALSSIAHSGVLDLEDLGTCNVHIYLVLSLKCSSFISYPPATTECG